MRFGSWLCSVIVLGGAIDAAQEPALLFMVDGKKKSKVSPRASAPRGSVFFLPRPTATRDPRQLTRFASCTSIKAKASGRIIPAVALDDRGRSRSILQSGSQRKNFSRFQIGRI
jgi:hypothetical protein